MKTYKLCPGGACPYAYIEGDRVRITDDYGGEVVLDVNVLKKMVMG